MSTTPTPDTDDAADIRAALATLVAHEPDLPSGTADIERRGRRRLATRRLGGTAAAAIILAAAGVGALSLAGGPDEPTQVASPPDTTAPVDPGDPAGGSMLPVGFPVGSAVDAAASALPAGVSLGELPMDIGWREGGQLDVPVVAAAGPATLTVQVADEACSAWIAEPAGWDALTAADLAAIADAVCAEWLATGSLPIIPADPTGEEQPDLAAQ